MTEQEKKWLTSVLLNIKVFPPFKQDDMEKVFSYFLKKSFPKNTVIIKEGTYNDNLYIIYRGSVLVEKKKFLVFKKKIKILRAGDFFGEISVFEDVKTTASVRTSENSSFFLLSKNLFKKILNKRPEFKKSIEKIIKERKKELIV